MWLVLKVLNTNAVPFVFESLGVNGVLLVLDLLDVEDVLLVLEALDVVDAGLVGNSGGGNWKGVRGSEDMRSLAT